MSNEGVPELLTVQDFCRRYSLSVATIYRLRDRGQIRFVKIGGATRIPRADAEAWAARLLERA